MCIFSSGKIEILLQQKSVCFLKEQPCTDEKQNCVDKCTYLFSQLNAIVASFFVTWSNSSKIKMETKF